MALENGNTVAIGQIVATEGLIHGKELRKGNVWVIIEKCFNENAHFPIPVGEELILVKDAIGSFVAWPEHLVIISDYEVKWEI